MSHIPKCFPPKGLMYIQDFERTNTKPFRERYSVLGAAARDE